MSVSRARLMVVPPVGLSVSIFTVQIECQISALTLSRSGGWTQIPVNWRSSVRTLVLGHERRADNRGHPALFERFAGGGECRAGGLGTAGTRSRPPTVAVRRDSSQKLPAADAG